MRQNEILYSERDRDIREKKKRREECVYIRHGRADRNEQADGRREYIYIVEIVVVVVVVTSASIPEKNAVVYDGTRDGQANTTRRRRVMHLR